MFRAIGELSVDHTNLVDKKRALSGGLGKVSVVMVCSCAYTLQYNYGDSGTEKYGVRIRYRI